MSSPSSHTIGASAMLWCSCQRHPAVSSRSPRRIATGSPSTTVQTPSPSSTKRNALCEWRCAGATSFGPRYCAAAHSVGVAYGSGLRPGLAYAMARRSPPRPTGTRSPARSASGSTSAHRHTCGQRVRTRRTSASGRHEPSRAASGCSPRSPRRAAPTRRRSRSSSPVQYDCSRRPPDFFADLDDRRELALLVVFRELVAADGRREPALRGERQPLDGHHLRRFVDPAQQVVVEARAPVSSSSPGRARPSYRRGRGAGARSPPTAPNRTRGRAGRRRHRRRPSRRRAHSRRSPSSGPCSCRDTRASR